MSRLQEVEAWRLDVVSTKQSMFGHPGEVLGDPDLTISDKRSVLASWASDAYAVENSPSFRQLASGAVVSVDDIMDALKTLDGPLCEAAFTTYRSFGRRSSKPVVTRRNRGPGNDDEPSPPAMGARMPSAWKMLVGLRGDSTGSASLTGYSREVSVDGRSAA